MRRQERIQRRQNEDGMLRTQAAAKSYFNRAEIQNIIAFVISAISVFTMLMTKSENQIWNFLVTCAPGICGVIAYLFYTQMVRNVKRAAILRNYFDAYVLEVGNLPTTDNERRRIADLVRKVNKGSGNKTNIQIHNTGRDDPPGVKNWYEFSKKYPDERAVYECQRQNIWWSKELINKAMIVNGTVILLVFLSGIAICIWGNTDSAVAALIIFAITYLLTFADRIKNYIAYKRLSNEIDGIDATIDHAGNEEQIRYLQERINDRRELPVLGMNYMHIKNSATLSKRYEEISAK